MSEQKIEQFWRDATAEDIANVMRGEKVEARFRDDTCDKWKVAMLGGYGAMSEGFNWIDIDGDCYAQCQVYDPQQWWLDKPDPGPGFRLLAKLPDEEPLLGDFVFCTDSKQWMKLDGGFDPGQRHGLWYRRRIEPIEVTPSNCVSYTTQVGEVIELPNGKRLKITQEGFEVL